MKNTLRPKLTYANVISTLALFVAIGGTSAYAANQLAKNSVGAGQLKRNSVTAAKIRNGAVTNSKLDPGARAGLTGPAGPQGPPGSAKAWARVDNQGGLIVSSGNVTVSKFSTGKYCINAGRYTTENSVVVASPDYSDPGTNSTSTVTVANGTKYNECAAGEFGVSTRINAGATAVDSGFTFIVG